MQPPCVGIGGGKPGVGALGVGEQRVARRPRRQRALSRAEHDRHVDVEADRSRQRRHRDTVADPTDATGHRIEFALQRRPEPMSGDGFADGIEVAQPVERRRERFIGPVLGLGKSFEPRAADPSLDLFDAPVGPFAPPASAAGMPERGTEFGDEREQ